MKLSGRVLGRQSGIFSTYERRYCDSCIKYDPKNGNCSILKRKVMCPEESNCSWFMKKLGEK
uniref:Uncharacterized protein n=1 Tax=viral metagenome TaxID=1070528 RepID=A0A6H1ZDA0_9ZZZZ